MGNGAIAAWRACQQLPKRTPSGPNRERDCLMGERTRIVNRIKSTLARLGIRNFKPIQAVAQSDEHIFNLSGGRATKAGQPAASSGGYSINPKGQPHSAMIAEESTSLVIYSGEPNEVTSVEVIDIEPVPGE